MYRDPMLRAERSIHKALDEAMFMSFRQRTREEDRRAQGLDELIGAQQVVTLYQPILDLQTMAVLGHEVFSRGPAGGPFEEAELMFALAQRTGRLVELERLCRSRALGSAQRHLKPGTKLFLNTPARTLARPGRGGGRVHPPGGEGGPAASRTWSWRSRSASPSRSARPTATCCGS